MKDYATLREIDQSLRLDKGAAFREFKRIAPELSEGRDYRVLRAAEDREAITRLRNNARVYGSSLNVVLLSPATRDKILAGLRAAPQ